MRKDMTRDMLVEIAEGLIILSKYVKEETCYEAKEDEIYIWIKPSIVSDVDKNRLYDIGIGELINDSGFVISL